MTPPPNDWLAKIEARLADPYRETYGAGAPYVRSLEDTECLYRALKLAMTALETMRGRSQGGEDVSRVPVKFINEALEKIKKGEL